MTVAAELITVVRGQEVGVTDLLTRIQAQLRQTDQAGQQTVGVFSGALPAGMRQSTSSALSLQLAQARLEAAQGNVAGAVQRVTSALQQQDTVTVQTINAERQLIGLQNQLSGSVGGVTGQLRQLNSALGAFGVGLGAAQLVRGVGELTQIGAQAQQTRERFDQLATQAHTTGDAMLNSLRQASAGTINDTNLQLAAMKANLLGVGTTAEQLGPLLAIARDRAQQMGISTSFAFDSLVTGLGRGSRLILDNIGVIVKESEVNEAYAKSVGKTVSALTDQEKKQALINEVLRQGNATLAATGGAIDSNVAKLERLNAQLDNLKAKAGGVFANIFGQAAEGATRLTGSIDDQARAFNSLAASQETLVGRTAASIPVFGQVIGAAQNTAASINLIAPNAVASAVAQEHLSGAMAQTAATAQQQAQANAQLTNGFQDQINAAVLAGNAQRLEAAATAEATTQKQVDTAATAALSAEAQLLEAQNQRTADAFLRLNPNISASAAAAAAAAAGYAPQIVRLIELTARANEARNALAQLNALANVQPRLSASQSATDREFDTQADRAKVHSDQALAANQKLLSDLNKQHRAHGATRLSDQQKLNNTLLNDQEKYQDQAEQAERDHEKKLLDIERDYQKKSLEQQRANELNKRSSELDYLKSITSSELNATKEGRAEITRINERYYADFDRAQKAAQAGNVKQSEEMVEQAKRRAAVEQQYAEQIEKARQEKNRSEIERLTALREKERQLLDEQDKQIAEGDPNQKARQEAIDAENERYAEAQDKAATAAENAAQRKIDAAERAGKKIDEENIKLREQERILNRIGPRPAATGTPAAATPGGEGAAKPTATGATGPVDLAAIAEALAQMAADITTAIGQSTKDITGAQKDTTAAVKGIAGRVLN